MQTRKRSPDFLQGGGEMGELIRSFNWGQTPLGDPETWDQSLKTSVRICLDSRFPILLWWGKDLRLIYNDGYRPALGTIKHPAALGQPGKEVWKEIWNVIGPMLERVMETGEATWEDDQLLLLERHGYPEETYWTYSYSAIRLEDNTIAGVFAAVHETTKQVISERQLQSLKDLGSLEDEEKTLESAFRNAAKALEKNNKDFPFAVIYKLDEQQNTAKAFAYAGIDKDHPGLPKKIDLTNPSAVETHFVKAVVDRKMVMSDMSPHWGQIPTGAWSVPPSQVIHVPITGTNKKAPIAILSTTLNPHRRFDEAYKNFIQLAADQVAMELNSALALEEERKRAEALAEIDKAKTLFFTNISHEFRTPLTLMLGPIEEALKDATVDTQNLARLEVAYRNAIRLLKLVNALLDFGQIESGKQKAKLEVVNIAAFTTSLVSNFRPLTEKAGLRLVVNAAAQLPALAVDKDMWEKIVFNLLSNAFKYTLEGAITVTIEQKTDAQQRPCIALQVNDTGVGMPENELPHVFERFHRIQHAGGRTFEGTGIGLSLTKELVQLHGGTITVESKLQQGSTFTVFIPLGQEGFLPARAGDVYEAAGHPFTSRYADEARLLTETTTIHKHNGTITSTQKKLPLVLVVDDNADMRVHIETLLTTKFNVITAANGAAAVEQLQENKPDVIVSDIMMPVMNGIELLKWVKNNKATEHIPVILLTARAGEESRIEGWETGADDYLSKPFSSKELVARITAQVDLARKRNTIQTQLRNLFMQAPVAIEILSGPDFVYEMVNEQALLIMNNAGPVQHAWKPEDVLGKTVEALVPETREQGLINLLKHVYETGEPVKYSEYKLHYHHEGKTVERYINFAFVPLFSEDNVVTHIMVTGDDITPLVQARKAIEESEKQLTNYFKAAPVGIVVYKGPEFRIELVNDVVSEIWGRSAASIQGKAITEVFPEIENDVNIKARHNFLVEKFMAGETVIANEEKLSFMRNGQPYTGWFNYTHEPLRDADGNLTGVLAVTIEVTDQVLARQKIELANRELEFAATISQSIADAVIGTTPAEDGYIIISWNQGAEKMYGWKTEEAIGKSIETVIATSFYPGAKKENLQQVLSKQGYWHGEVIQVGKDGTEIPVLASVATVRNNEGKILGTVAVNRDISESKKVEQKIRESERQLSNLANAMPQLVWIAKSTGEVIYYNERVSEFSGAFKGEDGNWQWNGLVHPDEIAATSEAWNNSIAQKTNYEIQHRVLMKDGSYRWHLSRAFPQKNEAGTITQWFGTATDIHEQKIVENKLRGSEARFRFLFDSNILPVAFWHINGEVYDANNAFLDLLGYTHVDMQQGLINWKKFTLPQDALLHEQKVMEALEGRSVPPYETCFIDKQGEKFSSLVGYAMLADSKEKGIAFMQDISKIKNVENELRYAKEQLEVTFKNIPSGIYQLDGKGRLQYVNEKGARLMGYNSAEEAMAQPELDQIKKHLESKFILQDEQGSVIPFEKGSLYLAIHTGKTSQLVTRYVSKANGTSRWVLSNSTPVYKEDGHLSFVLTTATDITESKRAEIALRDSEDRFRTLAETLPQMVWIRDIDGNIEYASGHWERYAGTKNISEAWKTMVHPDEWERVMAEWEKDASAGRSFRYDLRLKNKEGEYRWHFAAGEPVKDQSGKVIKWIGVITDVHAEKTFSENLEHEVQKRTAELKLSNQQLIEANNDLESFNYIASHDLQEPLRKIQTFIELIEKNLQEGQGINNRYFDKIKTSAKRMSELIRSILAYSRHSKTQDEYVPVDLNNVLQDIQNDFELVIKEKGAVIESAQLPSIKANPAQMHQLFANLIGNSLKFSKDKPVIKITTAIVTGNAIPGNTAGNGNQPFIYLCFSDNGIGFEPRFNDQIFQLFQRLHSKDEYSGTGIGLSIVKKIIDQNKGFISAQSAPGEGATFHVWLPADSMV